MRLTLASMDVSEMTFSIGTLIVIVGAVITVVSFLKKAKKDSISSIAADTQLRSDVDQLKKVVEDIQKEQKEIRQDFKNELNELDKQVIDRMNRVEEKIDGIKNLLIERFK